MNFVPTKFYFLSVNYSSSIIKTSVKIETVLCAGVVQTIDRRLRTLDDY